MNTSWKAVRTLGHYQWCLIALYLSVIVVYGRIAHMAILVIVPQIRFRCIDDTPVFSNLPLEEQLRLMPPDECRRPVFGADVTTNQLVQSNRSDFPLADCKNFVYDHQYFDFTATEQFDLVCDKNWIIPLVKTIYMAGFLCSSIGSGFVSDRFGRKTAIITFCLVGFAGNMLGAYSPYLGLFLFARFLVAASDVSTYACGLVLVTELLQKEQRVIPQFLGATIASLSNSLAGGVAMWFRDSRYFQTLPAVALLLGAVLFWFLSVESPRWLAAQNRHDDAKDVVRYIAEVNDLSEDQLSHLNRGNSEEKKDQASILDLFRTPLIRKRTMIIAFTWFCVIFVYFALTYNLGSFYDDVRLSLVLSGLMEMPSIIIAIFTVDRMGRPCSSFLFMILAGICCFLMIPFIQQEGSKAMLSLALIGKMMASNQLFILYLSTQELFPTVVRNMGLGCCSSVARIAGMLAPQIVLLNWYWPATTVLVLGVFGVAGGVVAPFLPDTTGIELAQTLHDGENFIPEHAFSLRWPHKARIKEINNRHSSNRQNGQELSTINQETLSLNT